MHQNQTKQSESQTSAVFLNDFCISPKSTTILLPSSSHQQQMSVPWDELPTDILQTISKNLIIYKHYIQFRAVCKSFSSIPPHPLHLPCQLPWLMLPPTQPPTSLRAFYNLSDHKFHRFELPETRFRRCCGSSHGWLILLEQNPSIHVFNFITKQNLHLPPVTTFPRVLEFNINRIGREYLLENYSRELRDLKAMRDGFIKKIVLSCSPVEHECIAVAILNESGELAYCKIGGSFWSMIDDARWYSEDVVFHNGLFYAVGMKGDVAVFYLAGDSPVLSVILPGLSCGGDIHYLVVSNGELFLVSRFLNLVGYNDTERDLIYMTVRFDVYKLGGGDLNWVSVESLGDCMFFLGGNSSLCLLASDFEGCEGNCIYFTDDYTEANDDGARGSQDVGVFRLEDRVIVPLPCWSGLPPHIWVTPNPC